MINSLIGPVVTEKMNKILVDGQANAGVIDILLAYP